MYVYKPQLCAGMSSLRKCISMVSRSLFLFRECSLQVCKGEFIWIELFVITDGQTHEAKSGSALPSFHKEASRVLGGDIVLDRDP